MFVGVGGQGTLLASRLLGRVLTDAGYDVKVSEVHGMSQRGGSVVTYVRYGKSVASPIVEKGECDVIVAFEQLEALRSLPYLSKKGTLIVNTQKIDPMPVITGAASYPDGIIEALRAAGADVTDIDALPKARGSGSVKAVNTVLLGVAAKRLGLPKEAFLDAIDAIVAEKFRAINKKAFAAGYGEE